MRQPGRKARFGGVLLTVLGLGAGAACNAGSASDGSTAISPQPQPNRHALAITAPCTAAKCGSAPASLTSPKCAPQGSSCNWKEGEVVSYSPCADSACGAAPGPDVCPAGTQLKGNQCGSENDAACAWTSSCAPPPSTTPCSSAHGCGPPPAIGVICQDGGPGELVCMQFEGRCDWQRSCD